MDNRLATEDELNPYAATEEELRSIVAGAPAPAPAPVAAQANPFYDFMYAAGQDPALATQRGIQYARQQRWTPEQTAQQWNQALGTNFTLDDFYRVTGLTPQDLSFTSSNATFSNFGDAGSWGFGAGAVLDPQTNLIKAPGTIFQSGKDAIVSDELFWNPHSVTGADLQKRIQDTQAQGQRAGVVITPYAVFQGKATNEQLLNEIKNSGTDFVTIDPYYLGFGPSSKELYDWAKSFIPQVNALGKEVKLVTQGFAPKGLEEDVLAHNQKMLALPGVSEFINFGLEDAIDLVNDPNWVSIGNDYGQVQPNKTGLASLVGEKPTTSAAAPTGPQFVFAENADKLGFWTQSGSLETGEAPSWNAGDGQWLQETQASLPAGFKAAVKQTPGDGYTDTTYAIFGPDGKKVQEQTVRYEQQGLGGLLRQSAIDLAPLALMALGMPGAESLGATLGTSVANTLNLTGLSAAQTAALGSAVGGAGVGLAQGQNPLDVLQNAIKTGAAAFLPSQVSSFIPSTGMAALDAALKTATEAGVRTAISGGNVESAVVGSLVNSGVGAATGASGLPPELVNAAIGIAKSGGDPQKIFNAVVGAAPALQNYYSKTDTGDETARLIARYGTADDNIVRQLEAMSPRGTAIPATTEDVQEAIFQDVLRQSPTQQIAPASTEVVQQAIQDDLNRELANIVYLNADNAGIKTQQEAARQASQRGLPGFIFEGKTYRLSQAPGYLSPEGKLYPSEAAYVATLGPRTITIPGVSITPPSVGGGRGISPGMTAEQAAQLPAVGAVTSPDISGMPTGEFYEGQGALIAGAGPGAYSGSSQFASNVQALKDLGTSATKVVPAMAELYGSGLGGLAARAVEFLTPPIVPAELAATGTESWTDPKDWMSRRTSTGAATFSDLQQQLKQEQENILAPLGPNERLAASGGASGLLSLTGALATGGLGGAIALGVSDVANKTWEDGKSRGLDNQTNAMRTAIQAGLEGLGEVAGAKYLGQLIKGLPITASASEIIQAIQTQGKALLGEVSTEVLTAIAQRAADGVKALGGQDKPITWEDAANEAYNATIQTIFAVGAQGAGHTLTNLGTPGQSTFKTETTPITFLGSTPQTSIVPTEGLPQQLTYQPPAPPPSQLQITGPEAAAPVPEIFGPESQLGFEEGVRPTAQQQLEEALSGRYEPPASPAPAPSVPSDTTGITPEMVAFIDEDGGIVTYGDLGLTGGTAKAGDTINLGGAATAPATSDATDAMATAPVRTPATTGAATAQNTATVLSVSPTDNTALVADAQGNTSVVNTGGTAKIGDTINLGGSAIISDATGPNITSPLPGDTSAFTGSDVGPKQNTGTVLSVNPANNTALVSDAQGNTSVVNTGSGTKVGDTINLGAGASSETTTKTGTEPGTTGQVLSVNPAQGTALVSDAQGNTYTVNVPTGTNPGDSVSLSQPKVEATKTQTTGTVLSIDQAQGTALVQSPSGSVSVVKVDSTAKVGDAVNLPTSAPTPTSTPTPAPAPYVAPAPAPYVFPAVAAPAPIDYSKAVAAPGQYVAPAVAPAPVTPVSPKTTSQSDLNAYVANRVQKGESPSDVLNDLYKFGYTRGDTATERAMQALKSSVDVQAPAPAPATTIKAPSKVSTTRARQLLWVKSSLGNNDPQTVANALKAANYGTDYINSLMRDAGVTTPAPVAAPTPAPGPSPAPVAAPTPVAKVMPAAAPAPSLAPTTPIAVDQQTGEVLTIADVMPASVKTEAAPQQQTSQEVSTVTGTVLSVDPTENTALVVNPNGDVQIVSVAPGTQPNSQVPIETAPQAEPATEATFAEPQMEEINRLFQDIYQQKNYPVATAPVTAPVSAQQTVIDLAPSAPAVTAPAQDLSAYQTALNQAVYGGTGGEPSGTSAPTPSLPSSAAPAVGTILSVDPTQGTALVSDPQGGTKVIDVDPATQPGDTVNLGTAPDLTTPIATDPVTGETITLGDVIPSAPAPSTTETKVAAPAETKVTSPAPAPAEIKTEAPAPSETKTEVAAPAPAETKTEAVAPAPSETKTEIAAPAPAEGKTEVAAPAPAEAKTEVAAPAPAETKTETTTPAPAETKTEVAAPAPAETKTEVAAPAPAETKTEVAAPDPAETKTEVTAPAPAPATEEVKTEAPAPATEEVAAPAPAETKTEAPAPAPAEALAPSPAPSEAPAPAEALAPAPIPSPAPTPVELPSEIPDVLPPVTPEELTKIVEGAPPSEPPAPPPPVAPTEPAPEPAPPPVSTPAPSPAPTTAPPPMVGEEDILPPVTEDELRDIVAGPLAPTPAPPPEVPVTEEEIRNIATGTPPPPPSAPTPSPTPAPAPAPRAPAPSPAQTALAQLPPQQRAAVEQLLQDIFQAPEADLLEMFSELSEEREQKRKERGAQLKSRKA